MGHERMLATRRTYTWIHKYIFPGGLLPSVTAIEKQPGQIHPAADHRQGRLRCPLRGDAEDLADRFSAYSGEVERLGFDEVFRRMWSFT